MKSKKNKKAHIFKDWPLFSKLDKDNDGDFDQDDVALFMNTEYGQGWLDDLLATADDDENSKISKGEYQDAKNMMPMMMMKMMMMSTAHNLGVVLSPFEATKRYMSKIMVSAAELSAGETVYDIGCGDGRLLINAVKLVPDIKAIGIELDKKRILQARKRIKKNGLEDSIQLIHGNAIAMNYSDADVVFTFLTSYGMMVLKPFLKKQLKPTARVVSHGFSVPGWKIHREVAVRDTSKYKNRVFVYKMNEI